MDFGHFGLKLGIFAYLSEIGYRFLPFLDSGLKLGRENHIFWSKMDKRLNKQVAPPPQVVLAIKENKNIS